MTLLLRSSGGFNVNHSCFFKSDYGGIHFRYIAQDCDGRSNQNSRRYKQQERGWCAAFISLLQTEVFGLSLFVNGNVRIGVFPERKKILIGLACGDFVAHHRLCASKL